MWQQYAAGVQIDTKEVFNKTDLDATTAGFGSQNVKMFVAGPDGLTLAQVAGYQSPEFLVAFLGFTAAVDPARVKESHAKAASELAALRAGESDAARRTELDNLHVWHVRGAKHELESLQVVLERAVVQARNRGC